MAADPTEVYSKFRNIAFRIRIAVAKSLTTTHIFEAVQLEGREAYQRIGRALSRAMLGAFSITTPAREPRPMRCRCGRSRTLEPVGRCAHYATLACENV
jgi:hypothetical protein